MSYLGPLRLHFAGRFQAAVSTVNNDPRHYDNATFVPADQELADGELPNGWWNPHGDADWRLIECGVTSAWMPDGSPAHRNDPVHNALVADSDRRAPAKLLDLDPCQQLVSEIWGLEIRITDSEGGTLMRGAFQPAPFFDIWDRAAGEDGDITACAYYQSVLTDVKWQNVSSSPFLTALTGACPDGVLSVKFMVDGYNANYGEPEFTRGRIVGTIGPGSAAEPRHMVRGRQFAAEAKPGAGAFFVPVGAINFCTAVVDSGASKVYVDLGNALPTTTAGGKIESIGELQLHAGEQTICPIPYGVGDWYAQSAGVVAVPADRQLTPAELEQIESSPLSLRNADGSAFIAEAPLYVRADGLVHRCDPGESATVDFYASRLGKPYEGATVELTADPSHLQPEAEIPVGEPEDAVQFPASITTGPRGHAQARIATSDPEEPRQWIDGQVYGIRPRLAEDPGSPVDQWNFVSVLVWSGFEPDHPPTWHGLQPIFQQYANLYPIMRDILDLSSYEDVCDNRRLLMLAFGLPPSDPNSMPVTRDLSSAKRAAILTWLKSEGPDGNPLRGAAPAAAQPIAHAKRPDGGRDISKGGKAAAAARRLILTKEAR